MTANKHQECYQTFVKKLEDDDVGDSAFNQTDTPNLEPDGEGGGEPNRDDTVVIDADGNYYYQPSGKIVNFEAFTKVSGTPVEKVMTAKRKSSGTGVPRCLYGWTKKGLQYGRHDVSHPLKLTGIAICRRDAKAVSTTKIKYEVIASKIIAFEKNDGKSTDATLASEICNEEEIYEFNENEIDSDEDQDLDDLDYESKGIIKQAKNTTENDTSAFTCMICSYRTTKKFLLTKHLRTHCDERPYQCGVCERCFKTRSALKNHRNTHLGYKPHPCSSCDKAFITSGDLLRHVQYRHTHIKQHKCTECDYSSVEKSKLRRHMRCHTGERPYQCPNCTYASADTFKLKRHMRVHTGEKPYECDICHARFTQSNSLKHHRLIHSVNDKPVFQCHLCPTTCGRNIDLRLHIKNLHNCDQPIPCKRCGKELPDRYSYKMHIKSHEGEKCFRCEYCPYASISQSHLKSHVLLHLDAKPFACDICQASFRQKPKLNHHVKICHSENYKPPQSRKKDHKCPHCNKMFAFNGNLIRHMETHDPTSRLYEEKHQLKMGRQKRVKMDGTVVMVTNNLFDEELHCEKTEEQEVDEEELQPEYEGTEDFNEDIMQHVYEEYEEQHEEEQYEQQLDDTNTKTILVEVKAEKMQEISLSQAPTNKSIITLKAEDKNYSDLMVLGEHDDQGFFVIEVMPDDEDDEEEQQEQKQKVQSQEVKPNKSTVNKSHKNSQLLISDYFGFGAKVDEEDEEGKGVIKILEIIKEK